MSWERKALSTGKDHTDVFPTFRSMIERTGAQRGDALVWAGCEGACYAMATFFSCQLTDFGLNLYFASGGDLKKVWRLEPVDDVGVIATKRVKAVKARILVLMSGLVDVPFENVLTLVRNGLDDNGVIIGETVVPRLFESLKWHEQMPIRFLFEFSMKRPTLLELVQK